MTGSLSKTTLAAYERDGYLFPIDVMSEAEAAASRARIEAAARAFTAGELKSNVHVVLPEVDALLRHPVVLDAVESILGPDILAWGSTLFIKEPDTTDYVSWHQDLTYWGLDATDEVTAWLALSPATPRSGCMRFVAGSHRRDIVPHRDTFATGNMLTRGQEIAVEVDEDEAVDVELRPGQVSLHHGRLFHASGANRSDDRRFGVAIRYITPSTRQIVGARDYASLVRGVDDHGHFELLPSPATAFAPEALALYDEVLEAQKAFLYVDA